jgi:beta-glucosidase
MREQGRVLLLVIVGVCLGGFERAAGQAGGCTPGTCAYLNQTLSADSRAKDLVERMTLPEKVSQTMDRAAAIPRLGVGEYNWWNEGLHGVARNGVATVFPQAIGLSATWDSGMVERVADVISTEARAKHNEAVRAGRFGRYSGLTYWSPNINIFRDPRWGRGQETYGEDPFLTASMGVAFIRGLQGVGGGAMKVIATPKHFAVHSGPEPGRHEFDVRPSAFDLEDTYLPAFRAAVVDAKAGSIMCAYNAVYGLPACASRLLLQDRLREAWQFKGYVVSDCDAIADVARGHHAAADNAHGSALALAAGTDLDCGTAYEQLVRAVQDGLVPVEQLDTALVRLFTARFQLGMMDGPGASPYDHLTQGDVHTAASRGLALQAARESIVLLKNSSNALPLSAGKRILVVGPTADLVQAVEGNYNGVSDGAVLPLDGIRRQAGAANVVYSPGSLLADEMLTPIPSTAFRAAAGAAVAGLRAEYFGNSTFTGPAALERVDAAINFDWDGATPSPGLEANHFSVRWSGSLAFPAGGTYRLHFRGLPRPRKVDVTGEGGSAPADGPRLLRLYLDGKLLIDSGLGETGTDVTVKAPGVHSLRIEFVRSSNERMVSLEWITPKNALLEDAVAKARSVDVVVAFVGLSPDLEGEEMNVHVPGFDGGDRTSLELPAAQQELLEGLQETGKPLVVVLTSGSALAANWAASHAAAVLEAWYGGEEAGTAVAETLAGINNPSGRLPVTFYRSAADLPAFQDYSMAHRTYRYFDGPVLYPFGFGLSYSDFTFPAASILKPNIVAGDPVTLTATVRNGSKLEGDEVVEVYLKSPADGVAAHPALAGFARVHLRAGESRSVTMTIPARQLSRVKPDGERFIAAGTYVLNVGEGQPGRTKNCVALALSVQGTVTLPK